MGEFLMDKYLLLPEGLRHAILVQRRSNLWLNAGLVFIHIPKAAGTSFNLALYGRFMGHIRASDVERWGSRRVRDLPSFAITRNPWDRLVSAYRFARAGRGIGGSFQARVWRPEQYRTVEFESFPTFVTDWLAQREIAKLDLIFRPQSPYVCDSAGRLLVDHVGRVENLAPTYEFLGRRSAIQTLPVSNRSGPPADYRKFYTPELVDVVGRIYSEDVQRFGYSFE